LALPHSEFFQYRYIAIYIPFAFETYILHWMHALRSKENYSKLLNWNDFITCQHLLESLFSTTAVFAQMSVSAVKRYKEKPLAFAALPH